MKRARRPLFAVCGLDEHGENWVRLNFRQYDLRRVHMHKHKKAGAIDGGVEVVVNFEGGVR